MKKKEYLGVVLTLLLIITMGFSISSNNISINSLTKLRENTWSIPLDNIVVSNDSNKENSQVNLSNDNNAIDYSVNLEKPGDVFSFDADIKNAGTIDAKIENILISGLTKDQEKYLEYIVTYKDGTPIKIGDIIEAKSYKTITVKVYMKEDITSSDLPQEDQEISLLLDIELTQK